MWDHYPLGYELNLFQVSYELSSCWIEGINGNLHSAWLCAAHLSLGTNISRLTEAVCLGFPGDLDSKESACNAGDLGLILGSGRSSSEGNGYPLQYSCLENFTEEPGGLQSMGSQRVAHDWATFTFTDVKSKKVQTFKTSSLLRFWGDFFWQWIFTFLLKHIDFY